MQTILRLLALIFILFCLNSLNAQELQYKDRIYLKQGSVIVGQITDYNPDQDVTIILFNGNELKFTASQIKKVVMYSPKIKGLETVGSSIKIGRIYNETQASFLTGASGTGVSIAHSLLYQQNSIFSFGAGLGLDNYYLKPGRQVMPLFATVKANLTQRSSSPYLGLKAGYGFAFKSDAENIINSTGGYMVNPYFGLRLGSRGLMINLFAGLKFQKADYEIQNAWENRREDILWRRLELGMSLMF